MFILTHRLRTSCATDPTPKIVFQAQVPYRLELVQRPSGACFLRAYDGHEYLIEPKPV